MKASKWLARWNYVLYSTRNNWKNLGELAYVFANMTTCELGAVAFMRPKDILKPKFHWYLTAQRELFSHFNSQHKHTQCVLTSGWKSWRQLSFWQQAHTFLYYVCFYVFILIQSVNPVYLLCMWSISVALIFFFFPVDIWLSFICVLSAEGRVQRGTTGITLSL